MASETRHKVSRKTAATSQDCSGHASPLGDASPQLTLRSGGTATAGSQVLIQKQKLHEMFGKVTLAILSTPRYRHLPLSDLNSIVLDPLMHNRISVCYGAPASMPQRLNTAGFTFWASVSTEVDAKLNEQVRAGVFPVRLKPEDWTSGTIHWLLDIVAPNPHVASQMLVNFHQIAKGNMVKFHPILGTLVDKNMLRNLISAVSPGPNPLASVN
jgi:cytolysin-activating lysine-acyltransferase